MMQQSVYNADAFCHDLSWQQPHMQTDRQQNNEADRQAATHAYRQTTRQRGRQTSSHTRRQTENKTTRQTDKQPHVQTDRQQDNEADRQAATHADRQKTRQQGRQTSSHTCRQTENKTTRQTDKQLSLPPLITLSNRSSLEPSSSSESLTVCRGTDGSRAVLFTSSERSLSRSQPWLAGVNDEWFVGCQSDCCGSSAVKKLSPTSANSQSQLTVMRGHVTSLDVVESRDIAAAAAAAVEGTVSASCVSRTNIITHQHNEQLLAGMTNRQTDRQTDRQTESNTCRTDVRDTT